MRIIFLLFLMLSTAFCLAYAAPPSKTPLMLAVENNSPEMVQTLLQAGANVDAKDKDGKTALMYAARNPTSDIVNILLKYGADVHAKDKDGHNALWHARTPNIVSREIVRALTESPDKIEQYLRILYIFVLVASMIIIFLFRKKLSLLVQIITIITALVPFIVELLKNIVH